MRNRNLPFHTRFPRLVPLLLVMVAALAVLAGGWRLALQERESSSDGRRQAAARIAPVGSVHVGASGEAARAAAAAGRAEEAVAGARPDGQAVYATLCSACHAAGIAGAPTLDKAAWEARIAPGRDTLYRHAIDGYTGGSGVMPPKGGNLGLSDEEVRASVDWMLDNLR